MRTHCPPPPHRATHPAPRRPAPSLLGAPTAAGELEGLSGLECEPLLERDPQGGASQAGLEQGRRGKQGATLRYQLQENLLP